jgi:hypothetical protein
MAPTSWAFNTAANLWNQTSAADFGGGLLDGVMVTNASGGGVQLASGFSDDFDGTALGLAWTSNSWEPAGGGPTSVSVSGGILSVSGAAIFSDQTLPGAAVEGNLSFPAVSYQHFGLATGFDPVVGNYWAIFSTMGTTDRLFARVNLSGAMQDVDLGGLPSGFHVYRVQAVTGGFQFSIDGVVRATVAADFPAGTPMRAALSTFSGTPQAPLQADWIRQVSYASGGTFTSSIFDAGRTATWGQASLTADLPPGTSIIIETSSGDTPTPDASWSAWTAVGHDGTVTSPGARYLRYRVRFVTNDPTRSPSLLDIAFSWS